MSRGRTQDALAEALGLKISRLVGSMVRAQVGMCRGRCRRAFDARLAGRRAWQLQPRSFAEGGYVLAGRVPAGGSQSWREPEVRSSAWPPAAEGEVIRALLRAHPYEEPAWDLSERRGEGRPIGRIGRVPDGDSLSELAARAASELSGPPIRLAGDPDAPIGRMAVVPGSGAAFLPAARAAGADAFLSGDLSHHAVRAALDAGLAVLDVGHAASERPGLARLFSILASLGVESRSLLDVDPDPWLPAS
jgi:putative NIF3 family GTP cyclohydrolase 1 type 2